VGAGRSLSDCSRGSASSGARHVRAFAGLDGERAAVERLGELRDARNTAQERLDQLGGQGAAVLVTVAADWDRLCLDERRALIRATVQRVTVAPGRGAGRVYVELIGQ
jgi:hypothetical protein